MSPAIPWAKPDFWGSERQYVLEAVESSWISGGSFVDRLETDIARFCGVPHAVSASNGTTALHMAYLALGISSGDEVVVPGFAFQAAANVALHMGARPIFTEVDPKTWCMRAADIEPVLSSRTKLIVPVHTYGNVCDMQPILDLAKARGIAVLEDAAEAFASRYRGKVAGAIAAIGSFSFQATKTITTGEGGMVVTTDEALRARMALFRSHGMLRTRYWHEVVGHNFRLTNMQAALGCAQFEKLERIVTERRRVWNRYRSRLEGADAVVLQYFEAGVEPVVWAIAARLDRRAYPQGRDSVMKQMQAVGIETRPGFYAASVLPIYSTRRLPTCEQISEEVISVPSYPSLSNEEIDRVCEVLLGFVA